MESGRKQDRKAVGLLVKLQHANVDTFAEEYATNLSPGGMFIRSRQPQPVGTRVKFEVQIAGGVRVMRGSAVVKWVRGAGDPAGAPGMGIQFDELDPATRALVDRMVAPTPEQLEAEQSAAALEAELKAMYGDPSKAKAGGALPPVAPLAPTIAPGVAKSATGGAAARASATGSAAVDAKAGTPAAAKSGAGAPSLAAPAAGSPASSKSLVGKAATPAAGTPASARPAANVKAVTADGLFDLDGEVPIESDADESLSVPIEFETVGSPKDAIDLPLDSLIADTPAPPEDEPFDFAIPPPSAPPPPELEAGIDIDFDAAPASSGTASGIDIDFEAMLAPEVKPAAVPPPARASAPPPAVAKAPTLPEVRRQDPREAPKDAPPPVLAKPTAPPPVPAPEKRASGPVFLKPPEKIDPTGLVIGIDLGTTNSCVGLLKNGKPIVMRSKEGYNTLPSIVSLTPANKLLVAHPAKNQMVLNPNRTIYGAKRLVGRPFDSPTVKQVRERFHYEVCPDDAGRAAVRLGEVVLSLEEVQGLVLRECREMAERELGKPVTRAVVTVPAYYSEPQREAVRKAGAMAGLKVERILNEPTAAALAFGMNRELDKKILVYDLGGGTFDATVLKIEKNVFEVLATGGDTFLGGVDFDNAIVDLLLEKFQQNEKIAFSGDSIALSRVSELAEKAKCALSERQSYDVHIPILMMDEGGKPHDLRCTITRDELTAATQSLIDRTFEAVRDVLLDAGLKTSDVDEVILVGGQSRMPAVREKLKEMFGKPPHASVNADEAVALGAALYSGSVDKVSSVVLIDVLPMTIGIGMPGGGFKRVLERNTPLPTQRSFSLPTSRDNEDTIEFQVFQGEDSNLAGNEYLGTVRIEGLPKAPKGLVKVAVTLRLDAECVLHAEATELSSRKAIKVTLATRYTSEQVQKKLGITQEAANKAQEKRAADLKGRGGGFWGFIKRVAGKK
ncbi:MAG: TIGR02266 family protein [Myxococcaceae bacterium]